MVKKMGNKEFKLIAGIVLLLIGLMGIGKLLSILLVIFGGYLVYEGLKKK